MRYTSVDLAQIVAFATDHGLDALDGVSIEKAAAGWSARFRDGHPDAPVIEVHEMASAQSALIGLREKVIRAFSDTSITDPLTAWAGSTRDPERRLP